MEYPIICILGERGDGKTLTATAIAYMNNHTDKKNVFANYHLSGIPYQYITFKDLTDFPEYLEDSIVIMDEMHIGSDSYEFFSKHVKDITTFITQLRKRSITLIYTTQRFSTIAKRMRDMTNYIIQCTMTDIKGVVNLQVYDRSLPANEPPVNDFTFDFRMFFGYYNTKEIIHKNIE